MWRSAGLALTLVLLVVGCGSTAGPGAADVPSSTDGSGPTGAPREDPQPVPPADEGAGDTPPPGTKPPDTRSETGAPGAEPPLATESDPTAPSSDADPSLLTGPDPLQEGSAGRESVVAAAALADMFVRTALGQRGDRYLLGAEASPDDADPDAFDTSELTQWAAARVGVTIPDGAMYQYLELKSRGRLLSVQEALRTRGALLFYFSSEPTVGGGRPAGSHVAIGLGDGRTVEARSTAYGVDVFAAGARFNYAGLLPGTGAVN